MFRALCAPHQVKIVLYSIWYQHTCRWPSRAKVESGLSTCALSWLIAKIYCDAQSAKRQNLDVICCDCLIFICFVFTMTAILKMRLQHLSKSIFSHGVTVELKKTKYFSPYSRKHSCFWKFSKINRYMKLYFFKALNIKISVSLSNPDSSLGTKRSRNKRGWAIRSDGSQLTFCL
jgi:hypothetical protein